VLFDIKANCEYCALDVAYNEIDAVFSVGNGEKRVSGENFTQNDLSFITPWCHVAFSGVPLSVYPRVNITLENNSFQSTPAFLPEEI
jgi:hypothetical protein